VTAAVLRGGDARFSLEPVELPPLGPGDVEVRIAGSGICPTDLLPRRGAGPELPVILGHEGSGVVERVGSAVRRVLPGDHVVITFDSCGTCLLCAQGHPAYCDEFTIRNLTGRLEDGNIARDAEGRVVAHRWFGQSSFATHAIASERNAVVIDRDAPLQTMAALGCGVQTGAGAILNVLRPGPEAKLVVFGAGAVGLSAVMAARLSGAREIVVVEPQEGRRSLALEHGATAAIPPPELDEIPALAAKADYTLDTTGTAQAIRTAVRILRPRGVCGVVSWRSEDPLVGPSDLVIPGRSVIGICVGDSRPHQFIPHLIKLWRYGRFPFDRLVETFPLERIDEAELAMASGEVVKPVLLPSAQEWW
jgi:aryl-alcohol dehydrogenase